MSDTKKIVELQETVGRLNAIASKEQYVIVVTQNYDDIGPISRTAIAFTRRRGEIFAVCTSAEPGQAILAMPWRVLTFDGEIIYDCHRKNSSSKS